MSNYRPSRRAILSELRRRQNQAFDEDAGAAADLIEKLLAEIKRLRTASSTGSEQK